MFNFSKASGLTLRPTQPPIKRKSWDVSELKKQRREAGHLPTSSAD
jgi:hypothetical protein